MTRATTLLLALLFAVPLSAAEPAPETVPVWTSGEDGYHTYRIPGLVVTPKGTVLAFCEGRKTGRGDHGDIDLLVKRSTDGGRAWSARRIVHEEGDTAKITIGNPCPVVDEATGTVHLPFCRDNDRVFVTRSEDDGVTWSEPDEITATVKAADWDWYATGPGHGIQKRREPHKGRLIVPCDHRVKAHEGGWRGGGQSHMIYSDDGGRSWHLGGSTAFGMNECEVVELADGSLLLSMRNYLGKNQRAFAVSRDGGETWSEPKHHAQVYCPTCQASLHRYALEPRNLILYSGPGGPGRKALTVRLSPNEGTTWPTARVLHEGPAAYSDLAVLPGGDILCLFEAGAKHPYETIRLARFPLGWLRGEAR